MTSVGPYLLMAFLFLVVALLTAVDASLTNLSLAPWVNGLRWLRVHFITVGMLTELAFGAMPLLAAIHSRQPRPKMRWDIWLALNVGLVLLVAGIPLVNSLLILIGGSLVFLATGLLMVQLMQRQTGVRPSSEETTRTPGRPFFVAGLGYLLLGVLVGTGLWLGWSEPLRIQVPIEVHIHANNWGFMSLVFAGLLIGIVPQLAGRPLASPRSLRSIFWMMVLGALGLVIGPWLGGNLWFTVPGLVLHLAATLWLLTLTLRALLGSAHARMPGVWHLATSYVWILAPVLIAPLIILGVPGFPGAGIEATAPQALIYGWVLQFGYALLPYTARRYLLNDAALQLGGSWLSLMAVHLGSALIWAGIFLAPYQGILHGTAYALYALSMMPIAIQLGQIVQQGLEQLEQQTELPAAVRE